MIVTIQSGPITVTGNTTVRQLVIEGTVDVTLDNLNIDVSADEYAGAMSLATGADVTLTLVGDNILKSGGDENTSPGDKKYNSGIRVPAGASLTIEAKDEAQSLTAVAGGYAAGIGGSYNGGAGTILITGGVVNAARGTNTVGIGGGFMGNGGTITITGGRVTAIGGIGKGLMGNTFSIVTITGGSVTVTGNMEVGEVNNIGTLIITGGSLICNGSSRAPTDEKGNLVYRCILANQPDITSVSVDAVPFWIDSNHAGDNNLYLYLTGEDHDIDVEIDGGIVSAYKATWKSDTSTFDIIPVQRLNPNPTSISLALLQNQVTYGTEAVTVTATVTDDSLMRPRTLNAVDFYLDGNPVPFASSAVIDGKATADLDTSHLEIGEYEVSAVYGGSYGGNTSSDSILLTVFAVPSVSSVTAPAPVDDGSVLSLTVPAVTENYAGIIKQGWEISTDGMTDWIEFDPETPVSRADNQKYLRYYAVNEVGTGYSVNTIQITVNAIVDAETPTITSQPQGGTFIRGTSSAVTITAGVTDGGVLSYQWYKNTIDSLTGAIPVGTNSSSYTPDTGSTGTLYYYCVVTNINRSINGMQTAEAVSQIAAIKVSAGGSSSRGSSSNNNEDYILPTWTIRYGTRTAQSITAAKNMTEISDVNGYLNLQIKKEMVKEGAEQAIRRWGRRGQNDISLAFENQTVDIKGLNVILESEAIDYLAEQSIKHVTIQSSIFRFQLDENAIQSLKSQAVGHVMVTVTPYQTFGEAAAVIGGHPVYDITFKDSTAKEISDFGEGQVTLGIAYKNDDSDSSNLIAVHIKADNEIERLTESYYNNGWLVFNRRSGSVYGAAYREAN